MKGGSPNIILFGETGSGKSSVVNLLAGKEVAQTSAGIRGCTTSCQSYSLTTANGVSYTIWDTVGLDEPMIGDTGHLHAIKQVCRLVRDLAKAGGVDLLLFCHREGRITSVTRKNYALLYDVACSKSVAIAIVITHLEREKRMEDWWDQNVEVFEQRGIQFCNHACVTTLSEDPKRHESRKAIEHILESLDSNTGRKMPAKLDLNRKDLVEALRDRCGLGEHDAHCVAKILSD